MQTRSQSCIKLQEAVERFFTPARRLPTETEQVILEQTEVSSIASNLTDLTLFSWGARLLRLPLETEAELRRLFERQFGEDVWQRTSAEIRAKNLRMPGLLFHERYDRKIAYTESQAIAQSWAGAQLISTSSLGHERILHDPGVIEQTVAFIQSAMC